MKSRGRIGVSSTTAVDRVWIGVSRNPGDVRRAGERPGRAVGTVRCCEDADAGAALRVSIGEDGGNMEVIVVVVREVRAGVAWMKSVGGGAGPALFRWRRLANLRGAVEEGITEQLEGMLSRESTLVGARTSLKRLLAGVAFTWTADVTLTLTAGVRLGFLSSGAAVSNCNFLDGWEWEHTVGSREGRECPLLSSINKLFYSQGPVRLLKRRDGDLELSVDMGLFLRLWILMHGLPKRRDGVPELRVDLGLVLRLWITRGF